MLLFIASLAELVKLSTESLLLLFDLNRLYTVFGWPRISHLSSSCSSMLPAIYGWHRSSIDMIILQGLSRLTQIPRDGP